MDKQLKRLAELQEDIKNGSYSERYKRLLQAQCEIIKDEIMDSYSEEV